MQNKFFLQVKLLGLVCKCTEVKNFSYKLVSPLSLPTLNWLFCATATVVPLLAQFAVHFVYMYKKVFTEDLVFFSLVNSI